MQHVAHDQLVAALTELVALIFLPVPRHDGDGHITFFDLGLRIEDRADDKVHRLRNAERAEVRPDAAALAVYGVAGQAAKFCAAENRGAPCGVPLEADFGRERGDFLGGHFPCLAVESGRFSQGAGQLLVAATAGAQEAQPGFGDLFGWSFCSQPPKK